MTMPEFILPPQYDPHKTEAKWQEFWLSREVFKANPHAGDEVYSIVIPPPNVTGNLHMGHAFNISLIDTLVRYHRMKGKNTLCLPGTDHASIAVQTLIEKQLKAEGKTRYDLGREKFLERAWQWKQQSGDTIVKQLKRLGLSADWSREKFTLDEDLSFAVKTAFIRLYEEGLIYRGKYMVNWCPESQSAVSDLEVENKEVDGFLWHIRYPLTDGSGYIQVATTRPETMLGDTAVAVNPHDTRYQSLIGKSVTLPLVGREIPIIADDFVDPNFGTGCVKVTPAHDPNDFQIGQRHNLPMINILNKDGSINQEGGEFAGQDRFVARQNIVKRLEAEGYLVKVEPYRHSVPYSDRGKVPVEPLVSTQWFVKIKPLAEKALYELENNQSPRFIPERWAKVYRDWLLRIQDWCISRQLWWGHQIPAWYVVSKTNGEITDDTPFVVAFDEEEAKKKATAIYGNDIILQQDPDVLDTWFSSALWPFSTLGWPKNTEDFSVYFPTTTMVTGFDIIFFWVARMTMMSCHFTGKIPFRDVYIHGLVRDENGKKMSKSANNGIDPLLLCDKYGTDALRYTLIREVAGAGQDISLQYDRKTDESKSVEASRNFANKLWNAARFVLMNLDGQTPAQLGYPSLTELELSDRWILSRFNRVVKQTTDYLENYGLGEAAKGLYDFIWGDFCDWYIELVKPRLQQDANPTSRKVAQQTLAYVLEGILKLLHPFMPHITEEIWHTLTQKQDDSLALQSFPVVDELITITKNNSFFTVARDNKTSFADDTPPHSKSLYLKSVVGLLNQIPKTLAEYQQPLLVVILLVVLLVVFRLAAAVVSAVDSIPLFPSFFRLVGLFYILQFSYNSLLFADKRKATVASFASFLKQIPSRRQSHPRMKETITSTKQPEISSPPSLIPNSLIDEDLESEFQLLFETIRVIRNLRAEAEIKPAVKVNVILQSENPREREILQKTHLFIRDLAKVENIRIVSRLEEEDTAKTIASVVGTIQVLIPLQGVIDVEKFTAKLEKKLAKIESEINSLQGRLNNPNFTEKAPTLVVETTRHALEESQKQREILRKRLQLLK
ncbi:MAG TPA: valine--tRNA ligase [Geminocystis sp. M7585_C2015_104]|nr:valine--tRNA ligase [Geminocystis sp. M7585_C2015_104]